MCYSNFVTFWELKNYEDSGKFNGCLSYGCGENITIKGLYRDFWNMSELFHILTVGVVIQIHTLLNSKIKSLY